MVMGPTANTGGEPEGVPQTLSTLGPTNPKDSSGLKTVMCVYDVSCIIASNLSPGISACKIIAQ